MQGEGTCQEHIFELLGTLNKTSIPVFICEEIGTERWIKKKVNHTFEQACEALIKKEQSRDEPLHTYNTPVKAGV
ncbi:hypothetical protein AR441_12945 [Bacillus velezensis]|nr:hypothetical protein AR441_12945 [Bacillus velezensis]